MQDKVIHSVVIFLRQAHHTFGDINKH